MKVLTTFGVLLAVALWISCQPPQEADASEQQVEPVREEEPTYRFPAHITRTIKRDRQGRTWVAAFDGVFRYADGAFTRMPAGDSTTRFFSILEDWEGNMWFGAIGEGVFRYDGKAWRNFTTADGLINNEVGTLYADRAGNIWLGANGGLSRYDGKRFHNFKLEKDTVVEDRSNLPQPNLKRPPYEVTDILEDATGQLWIATRGPTFLYDGKQFSVLRHNGKAFSNVRSVIEDGRGRVWLGGNDGLWRYAGGTFTQITDHFTGYIYEDDAGNLWTSSQDAARWQLSRYAAKTLSAPQPAVKVIRSPYPDNKGMIFGIQEVAEGTVWFGGLNGVYVYDGQSISPLSVPEDME